MAPYIIAGCIIVSALSLFFGIAPLYFTIALVASSVTGLLWTASFFFERYAVIGNINESRYTPITEKEKGVYYALLALMAVLILIVVI